MYYEDYSDVRNAIAREKQLKNWKREWKIVLIRKNNPELLDIAAMWIEKAPGEARGDIEMSELTLESQLFLVL